MRGLFGARHRFLRDVRRGPRAGSVKYAGDLTLLKALTQAGGLTPLAAGSRVDVIRGSAEKKDRNQDVRLQPNDIITVSQRRF